VGPRAAPATGGQIDGLLGTSGRYHVQLSPPAIASGSCGAVAEGAGKPRQQARALRGGRRPWLKRLRRPPRPDMQSRHTERRQRNRRGTVAHKMGPVGARCVAAGQGSAAGRAVLCERRAIDAGSLTHMQYDTRQHKAAARRRVQGPAAVCSCWAGQRGGVHRRQAGGQHSGGAGGARKDQRLGPSHESWQSDSARGACHMASERPRLAGTSPGICGKGA
jgi:hypothetical protein